MTCSKHMHRVASDAILHAARFLPALGPGTSAKSRSHLDFHDTPDDHGTRLIIGRTGTAHDHLLENTMPSSLVLSYRNCFPTCRAVQISRAPSRRPRTRRKVESTLKMHISLKWMRKIGPRLASCTGSSRAGSYHYQTAERLGSLMVCLQAHCVRTARLTQCFPG